LVKVKVLAPDLGPNQDKLGFPSERSNSTGEFRSSALIFSDWAWRR
jgi:hypothetical protein